MLNSGRIQGKQENQVDSKCSVRAKTDIYDWEFKSPMQLDRQSATLYTPCRRRANRNERHDNCTGFKGSVQLDRGRDDSLMLTEETGIFEATKVPSRNGVEDEPFSKLHKPQVIRSQDPT